MENENAFKNKINSDVVGQIAREIKLFFPGFEVKNFSSVATQFPELEFRARAVATSDALKKHLPDDYPKALEILLKVIKNKKLSGFSLWPFSEFIGQHGLNHFDESLNAMYFLTQEFTGEFAVRAFFIKDHQAVLEYFRRWVHDENVHVRRFVSEGSRPLLPWGLRLDVFKKNPELSVALLDFLKNDDQLYVRKSVANHLNDVAKFAPELVIKTIQNWEKSATRDQSKKIEWIKRQALRTLIKKGHSGALQLMGVSIAAKIKIRKFKTAKTIYKKNGSLTFEFNIQSQSATSQKLIIDYVVYFLKSNGKNAPKVFKLKSLTIEPKKSLTIRKSHSLRPITTMKYYKGPQYLALKINGVETQKLKWIFA